MDGEKRTCITCGETKPVEQMALRSGKPRNQCKSCKSDHQKSWIRKDSTRAAQNAERAREWRRINPERTAEYTNRNNEAPGFRERKREYMRNRYQAMSTDERRDAHFRAKYGISLDEYRRMEAAQGGLCAICGQPPSMDRQVTKNVTGVLVVDHCHDTGAVRGLLCTTCNLAIGYLKNSPDMAMAAAAYLLQQENVIGAVLPRGTAG